MPLFSTSSSKTGYQKCIQTVASKTAHHIMAFSSQASGVTRPTLSKDLSHFEIYNKSCTPWREHDTTLDLYTDQAPTFTGQAGKKGSTRVEFTLRLGWLPAPLVFSAAVLYYSRAHSNTYAQAAAGNPLRTHDRTHSLGCGLCW